jgi:hypothetical protein
MGKFQFFEAGSLVELRDSNLPWFVLFANAFLSVTSHFSTHCDFVVSLPPAIFGFSFRALR